VTEVETSTAPAIAVPCTSEPRPARQWALDALRIVAIAGVLAIHTIGHLINNRGLRGGPEWWAAVSIDIGSRWVVPVFVMVSGALVLAPRAHAGGPADFYRKRFVRILPAMVVWHLVYLFLVRIGLDGWHPNRRLLAVQIIDAKVYTALYFLWLIAGLYVIAPVLVPFLREGGRRRALITAGVALAWTMVTLMIPGVTALLGAPRPIELGAWTMWWPYVGYFLAGWALHTLVLRRAHAVLAVVAAALMLAEGIYRYGHRGGHRWLDAFVPVSYLGLSTAIASICLFLAAVAAGAAWTPSPQVLTWLKRLSDASFGVFLVHLLIYEVIRLTVPVVAAADSLGVLLAAFASVLVASFAVSLGAARVPYLRTVF
jgi:surface polysaccharide O-acyltransferase-like enzyme